jgi:hypothetical protein
VVAAQLAADQCTYLVNEWVSDELFNGRQDPTAGQTHPCEGLPLFVPGRTPYTPDGQASSATVHYWEAIVSDPAWIKLNRVTQADREASGISPKWKDSDPICKAKVIGQNCDEYPFSRVPKRPCRLCRGTASRQPSRI